MHLKLTEWFLVLNLISTLYVLSLDASLALFYSFASACVALPVYFVARVSSRENTACFILMGSLLWITYLLRPMVLIPNPELFTYSAVLGVAQSEDMRMSLIKVGFCSLSLMSGLYVGFLFTNYFIKKKPKNSLQLDLSNHFSGKYGFSKDNFLLKKKNKVTLVIFLLIILDGVAKLILNVGLKTQFSDGPSSLNAILRIILPQFLIYSFIAILLLKYKVKKRILSVFLLLFFLLDLISGSKGAFAEIAIILFAVNVFLTGNVKIKLSSTLSIVGASVFAMFVTFTIANTIRFSSSGYNGELFSLVFDSISQAFSSDAALEFSNSVTGRFIGFDGLIATEMYSPSFLTDVFELLSTLSRALSKINPLDSGGGAVTSGKALGLVYFALDDDFAFAGAVGLFGALQLMVGSSYLYVASAGAGIISSSLFNLGNKFKSSDFSISFLCLVVLLFTRSIMSGNLDISISSFVVNVFSLFAYWIMLSFL